MKVMDFLYATKDKTDRFKLIWHTYSAALKRTDVVDLTPLVSAKNEAEEALYGVMCRTERFNSGIIDDSQVCDVQVLPEDILSFAECQHLMDCLSHENKKYTWVIFPWSMSNLRLIYCPLWTSMN